MAAGPSDTELREAARHRGFRLVKSRVKTPGRGDYGKYGLVDPKGTTVFGRDADGALTASVSEVAAFLRRGSASTWAASVETAPDAPAPKSRIASTAAEDEVPLAIRPRKRARRSIGAELGEEKPARGTAKRRTVEDAQTQRIKAKQTVAEPKPELGQKIAPAPKQLHIRRAAASDADAVANLVVLLPGDGDRHRIAAMCGSRGANILVADRGAVVGVVSWVLVPTLQRGTIGRITAIVVVDGDRRAGIGTALLDEAVAAMAKAGVVLVEAISDIEIRNAHGFFRELGFDQTSYRFAKAISIG